MEMRSFVVTTLLCLGFFVTVAASAELPLMPPLDRVHKLPASSSTAAEAREAPGLMSRLIRLYFGDQVRWQLFLGWPEKSTPRSHHRVVREYRPHRGVETTTTVENVELPGVVGFYLRGNPSAPNPNEC